VCVSNVTWYMLQSERVASLRQSINLACCFLTQKRRLSCSLSILSRLPRLCGSVTNNSTWVRIGYRIYSLWRFTAAHITIIMNTIALKTSRVPLTELYCADVSLGGLISSASRH
jgi:hypothetical protein